MEPEVEQEIAETTPVAEVNESQAETGGGNPAWKPFLDVLPTSLHPVVTPVLKDWDKGVQGKFQEIHQRYEPWKPFVEKQIDPQVVYQGMQLLDLLENNPQAIYSALAETLGLSPKEVQQVKAEVEKSSELQNEVEEYKDPRIDQLEQGFQTVGQMLLAQKQQEEDAKADAELEAEFTAAKQKYGDFDEEMVAALAWAKGIKVDDAAKAIVEYNKKVLGSTRPSAQAPIVMGNGGGIPSANNVVNPATMTDQQRRELAINMLKMAKEGSG